MDGLTIVNRKEKASWADTVEKLKKDLQEKTNALELEQQVTAELRTMWENLRMEVTTTREQATLDMNNLRNVILTETNQLKENCQSRLARLEGDLKRSEASRKRIMRENESQRSSLIRMREVEKILKAENLDLYQQLAEKMVAPVMVPNETYETQLAAQAQQLAELQSAYEALKEESERGYETRYTEELQKVTITGSSS